MFVLVINNPYYFCKISYFLDNIGDEREAWRAFGDGRDVWRACSQGVLTLP